MRRAPQLEPRRAPVLVGTLALITVSLALALPAAAAPPREREDMRAPKMAATRTLDDALAVEAGATCLARPTLLGDILSYRDDDRVDPRVAIRVWGSSEDAHALRFEVRVGQEVAVDRRFDAAPDNCADLHAVVALAIAIALDDALPAALGIVVPVVQVEAGEGDLPDFSDEPPPDLRPDSPSDLPRRRRGPPLGITAAAAAFVAVTPRLSGGAELSFDVRPVEHFDVRVGALVTHLADFALDLGRVDVTVAAARVDLCWGSAPRRARVRLCGGAAGGASVSAGQGFNVNFRGASPWFAGLVSGDLSVRLVGPLALELRVSGVFPFQRTDLLVNTTDGAPLARERFPVAGAIIGVGPRLEF